MDIIILRQQLYVPILLWDLAIGLFTNQAVVKNWLSSYAPFVMVMPREPSFQEDHTRFGTYWTDVRTGRSSGSSSNPLLSASHSTMVIQDFVVFVFKLWFGCGFRCRVLPGYDVTIDSLLSQCVIRSVLNSILGVRETNQVASIHQKKYKN